MSSFRQNGHRINGKGLKAIFKTNYKCPQCGKQRMQRVAGPCEFDNGDFIPHLERMHGFSCGSDFFDPAAMDVIEEFWKSQKQKSTLQRRMRKSSAVK